MAQSMSVTPPMYLEKMTGHSMYPCNRFVGLGRGMKINSSKQNASALVKFQVSYSVLLPANPYCFTIFYTLLHYSSGSSYSLYFKLLVSENKLPAPRLVQSKMCHCPCAPERNRPTQSPASLSLQTNPSFFILATSQTSRNSFPGRLFLALDIT